MFIFNFYLLAPVKEDAIQPDTVEDSITQEAQPTQTTIQGI